MNDAIVSVIDDPSKQWIVAAILSILIGPVVFLVVRFLASLPASTRRTLLKIVLLILFFPLIFLILACTPDPDE